ncbi:MAG: glucosaminidase domain-containing protein [Clostridia bacterium]|nr:glucosaminidase domain-containing protein [Clostridia bacterium]
MRKLTAVLAALMIVCTQLSACAPGFVHDRENGSADTDTVSERTSVTGVAEITLDAAKRWAEANGASAQFTAAAASYWKYGEITGIRPEVLYAQAALETAYGNFGGAVTPDMNNFAGIKTANAVGMAREDHEAFPTIDDGVRAHFNHMSAYVGTQPIGEVHGRYYTVKRLSWAGTVKYVEELSGKWCPREDYGNIIVENYLKPMYNY